MKPHSLLAIILLITLTSCKQRFYRAGASSMENTIMIGQNFYVSPTDDFKRNDIVTFSYYGPNYGGVRNEEGRFDNVWEKRVYRLVAYSGDLVEMKNGDLFVNGLMIALPPRAKLEYIISSTQEIPELSEMDPNVNQASGTGDSIYLTAALSAEDLLNLRKKYPSIKTTRYHNLVPDTIYATSSAEDHWSQDTYGPLKIPSVNDKINVNEGNYKLFKNIPGIQMGDNIVKEKLYFVMGDNRYGAEDSRFIGLISHSKMDGIVKMK